jgi:protein-tyrosine phosphatase
MIDLHSHILPSIDDGAADMAASLELARLYVAAGFKMVVATPHARSGECSARYARAIVEAVDGLNREFYRHEIDLRVLPGMEVELDARLPAQVAAGALIPLAGKRHLLVETPFMRLPLSWQNMVFDLAAMDITVVFAHPERCAQLAESPGLIDEMAASGACLQVNWDSFAGAHGRTARHVARHMARHGLIHCLATDSHDPLHRHPGMVPGLKAEVAGRVGPENLALMCRDNPLQVVNGRPMQAMDTDTIPLRARRKRPWWRRWLR